MSQREKSWWFLIKGQEMCELENEWDSRKLESCYGPSTSVIIDLIPSQPCKSQATSTHVAT